MRKIKFVFNRINDTHVSGHIEFDEDMCVYFVICKSMADQRFGYSVINEKMLMDQEKSLIERRLEEIAEKWWDSGLVFFTTPPH